MPKRLIRKPSPYRRVQALSFGQRASGNLIIQGENASVLQGMQDEFKNEVRCIYIDPPYNNQEDYTHYLDTGDHETWKQTLATRLKLLWPLLAEDGSIWISIDDREVHYLKVLCDQVFGRGAFVATIVWNHRKTRENRRVFSFNHEYILVYAPKPSRFATSRGLLPVTDEILARYRNPDNDPRGPWQSISANVQAGHAVSSQFYEIVSPSGRRHWPPTGRCWVYNAERMRREVAAGNIWFGPHGIGVPRIKKFVSRSATGLTPQTLWMADDVGSTHDAKRHLLGLFPEERPFDTPKPEPLIARILHIATLPGDLVLDAYLGSGTTAAVAHKLGRRYVGIEEGDHAATIAAKRVRAVVEGESGGISGEVAWSGGGGFDFLRRDPSGENGVEARLRQKASTQLP